MLRFYILAFFIPLSVNGQSPFNLSKQEETKIYTQAITEYLKALDKGDTLKFDTLFVGPMDKDVDENIKDIELPKEILKTKIAKLTELEGRRKVEYHKTFVFVNIIGTLTPVRAEFIFITFVVAKELNKPAWRPQHNFVFHYKYDITKKEYVFDRQKLHYQYAKKPKSHE